EVMESLWKFDDLGARAGSAARIYALSGDSRYARSAISDLTLIDQELAEIEGLVADNPVQVRRVGELKTADAARADYVRTLIAARRQGGSAAAHAMLNGSSALTFDDDARRVTSAMRTEERALLSERGAAAHRAANYAFDAIVGGLALAFVFVGVAGVYVNRGLTTLKARSIELVASRDESRRQADMLAAVLKNMTEAVAVCDAQSRTVLRNAAAEKIPGGIVETGGDRSDYDFFADDGRPLESSEAPIMRALRGETIADEVIMLRRRDGGESWLETSACPLRGEDGAIQGAVAIARDISERRRTMRQLAERSRELERSNADLEQFAYTASHDLQEPLRMVASYVQLLRDRYRGRLDSDADDFIDFAVDGATRMKRLINDLLTYSRAGKGRELAPIDAEAPLGWALSNLELAISEARARVTHDPLPRVLADEGQLGELFQNLIANAIKFRGERDPEIHVSAERKGSFVEFAVADNGIGIDPRHNARIFMIFQRLHSRANYPGTGIGLALCRRIVDRHGGRIWVESAVGKGATFRFTLQTAEADAPVGAEGTQWRSMASAS
ncbi:MAG TPA: ATP-binding protein, partial [Candidatus Binataceae bacterium]|nr:ATP-binding protein [Candidatus Binataceae bacterium]